jgi:ketosteroid isomerase-like protein
MRRLTLFLTLLVFGALAEISAGVGAPAAGPEAARAELLETDARFSKMSVSRGVPAAFLAFMDDDAVILPPGLAPIRGRDAIAAYYEKTPPGTVLEWKPLATDVSSGEDLGYTYGTYELRGTDTQGKPVTRSGKYVSVWRKQPDDSWKWTLDMGNIDPPSPSPGGASPAEATIRTLEAEGRKAALSGDPEAHDRLLAADWTNINTNGTVTTKPQLLALLKSSPFTFLSIEDEDVSVRIFGETAVVTGRSTRKRAGPSGEAVTQAVRFTRVYAERDGRWQVVSAQTTPITPP